MKREDLKALGIDDEGKIDAIMALNGKAIENHKGAAQTAQSENETLKTQLTEANKQIEGFKGMDIEGVKKAADDWKAKAEQAQKDATDQLAKFKFDAALEKELKETYKVKDPRDVIPHLKADMLKLDEGKFIGLKEQIEPLQTAKDYLFKSDAPPPVIVKGGNSQSVLSDAMSDAARKAAGLPTPAKS